MPAIGKVTLDAKEYEATLEKLKQKTAAAAQNMSNSAAKSGASANKAISDGAKKVGSDVSAAGGALSAFGAAAGSHLGAAGQAVSALAAGPIAALVGALGALLAVGIAVWDKLTLSSEEYAAKMAKVAERSDKARQTLFGRQADDAGYMARLQELAQKESLSNASKAEATNLIKTLTSRYGELGLSIDSVTGSIKGADEAQRQMLARQKQQRISSIRRQFSAHDKKAYTQAQAAVTGMFVGEETLNKIGLGWKSASKAKDNVAEVMETRSLKDRLEMAERLRDASNTQADMNNWQAVIDTIEKQIALQEELNSLRETGDLNAQERAARLKREAEESQKRRDFFLEESRNAEYQRLTTGTVTVPGSVTGSVSSPDVPEVPDQTYSVTGSVSSPDIPEVPDQTYSVTYNLLGALTPKDKSADLRGLDYRGSGESRSYGGFSSNYLHDYHYASLAQMWNEPLIGRRVLDILGAIKFLRAQGAKEITLRSEGLGIIPAVFAAVLSEVPVKLYLEDEKIPTYAAHVLDPAAPLPQSFVPWGILKVTDIDELIKLFPEKFIRSK